VTDEVADRPDVILHPLRECQSAAHQPREPLPECIIEPFDKAAACVSFLGADNLIAKRERRAPCAGWALPTLLAAGLLADGDRSDVQRARVPGNADDLHFLRQILLGRQLPKDTVLGPHREQRRQGRFPQPGAVDRLHLQHHLALSVGQLVEVREPGLGLTDFRKLAAGAEHIALDDRHAPAPAAEGGHAAGGEAVGGGGNAGEQQGCRQACS
jgi:hypothetical protein